MFVLAMPIGMTAPRMAVTVVTTITMAAIRTTIVVVIMIVLFAHVVTQRATGTAACCGADQATGGAAHAAADHVTACCAQRTAKGGFATAVFVCADGATTRATQGPRRWWNLCCRLTTDRRPSLEPRPMRRLHRLRWCRQQTRYR